MKKIYLLLLLVLTTQLYSSNGKYRLTLRDSPATSIVIGWDQTSGSTPVVYYGTTDYGTNYTSYPNSKVPDRTVSYKGMNNTFARLTGLTPNTAYYFVIHDSEGTSERFWFKTAPADNSRLSFVAGGDSRNNRTPRQNANRLVAKLKPHAVLFGGDMTNGDSNGEWRDWFNDWQLTIADDNRMFPIVATRGNHEDSNNSVYHLFDVPSANIYYAITFGNNLVRTYTLNTEISITGNQTTWLQNDLDANPNTVWKMAQYHKPMRPHVSSKREGNNQYNSWAQLFYDKEVKLVIECDAHTVKTTWPVRPSTGSGSEEGFVRDDQNGTVYAGEGCWGAPLRSNNDNKSWTRNSARFNQFKWIFVDENKIETRTIKVDNASQVGSVSNDDPFTTPTNLDIWSPSNGSVVTINNNNIADEEPPSAPASLNSFNVTASTVSLNWEASIDNVAVSGYDVYQNNIMIGSTATTGYDISGLAGNTTYSFKVQAKDRAGNISAFSTVEDVTTLDSSTVLYTVGVTTIGDRDATHATRRAMPYTMTENGILQSISLHIAGGTGEVQLGVYADNNGAPGDRLAATAITPVRTTRGWQTISLETPVTVLNGNTVWLAWMFSNHPGIAYVSGTPGRYEATGSSWSAGGNNMPSSYGSGAQTDYRYSVYANYLKDTSIVSYTLTTTTEGQGSVSGAGTYPEGTSVTLTASPAAGWQFESWSGTSTNASNPLTIVMQGNTTITANFTENTSGGASEKLGIVTVGDRNSTHTTQRSMPFTMTKDGTLESLSIHIEGGTGDVQLGVYADNNGIPGNRLGRTAITSVISTRGWQTVALETPVFVNNGDTIWLSWIFSNNPGVAYVSGTPGRYNADGSSWSATGNMPSTHASGLQGDYRYSVYATFTTAGTSEAVPSPTEDSAFSIFPNPFTSEITIATTAVTKNTSSLQLIIYNLAGEVVSQENVSMQSKIVIQPKIYRSGIYLLSIIDKNNNVLATKRLIKK
ncbi:fibronectin type III domain-containing protein [Aquimarina sp. U1-2]|uniref:InlB B-repeat-containing protein n=1 Tax=Aquimarina sp. U1-2 TaxID=2823141 RepID=UPI001AECB864|nr:fibronectin type III domain-containing protein [Aquimarina sp. U1-2]MBP2832983.1 fibronectin type III domain-containing protein [Aquimarina sp. U1-2]